MKPKRAAREIDGCFTLLEHRSLLFNLTLFLTPDRLAWPFRITDQIRFFRSPADLECIRLRPLELHCSLNRLTSRGAAVRIHNRLFNPPLRSHGNFVRQPSLFVRRLDAPVFALRLICASSYLSRHAVPLIFENPEQQNNLIFGEAQLAQGRKRIRVK